MNTVRAALRAAHEALAPGPDHETARKAHEALEHLKDMATYCPNYFTHKWDHALDGESVRAAARRHAAAIAAALQPSKEKTE